MITADYYPNRSRLDFIAPDGMPGGGIIGDRAHIKAALLLQSNNAMVRVCLDNSVSKKSRNRVKCTKTIAKKLTN
jgi:hypothetical protein